MKEINELLKKLSIHFNWNLARMKCLAQIIEGLFLVKTVNLTEIASSFYGKAQIESHYKRLQRFFRWMKIDLALIAKFVATLFPAGKNGWDLSMDRTNWKLGKKNINLLVIGIVYKGIAIPLIWNFLDKKGNSSTEERIILMERFIKIFGKEKINCLLADREFVGKDWFLYLRKQKISFYIRIKNNTLIGNRKGIQVKALQLFRHLRVGEAFHFQGKRYIFGHRLRIAAMRLKTGELLIVVTDASVDEALEKYALRWEIETLFTCLKTRGFRFEDTHLTIPDRVNKLLAVLTIAFCWAHKTGEWLHETIPIPIKKHGRKAKSIFRYGLDYIRQALLNINHKFDQFLDCLQFLLPVKPILLSQESL